MLELNFPFPPLDILGSDVICTVNRNLVYSGATRCAKTRSPVRSFARVGTYIRHQLKTYKKFPQVEEIAYLLDVLVIWS